MDVVSTKVEYAAAAAPRLAADAPRAVLAAARDAVRAGRSATLAVVVDTEGSTYVARGALALFAGDREPTGWLSGGCLEPEIGRHAAASAASGELGWLDIDTRDDEDLLSGSMPGCRGRLRLALLPLRALPGIEHAFAGWLDGGRELGLRISADGDVETRLESRVAREPVRRDEKTPAAFAEAGFDAQGWRLPSSPEAAAGRPESRLAWPPPPELLLFGAGPETAALLPTLQALGWRTTLVERRPRWRTLGALADAHLDATPTAALSTAIRTDRRASPPADAALVMHHHFELDREALHAVAEAPIAYVGLLGPVRRREDLFRVLPPAARASLAPRLRSPVGLHLGGHGAAAIALSIAAQLQAWRHGLEPR